jgi:hypothetical protein
VRQSLGLPLDARGSGPAAQVLEYVAGCEGLTGSELAGFVQRCLAKYEAKRVDPGGAGGRVAEFSWQTSMHFSVVWGLVLRVDPGVGWWGGCSVLWTSCDSSASSDIGGGSAACSDAVCRRLAELVLLAAAHCFKQVVGIGCFAGAVAGGCVLRAGCDSSPLRRRHLFSSYAV